MGIINVLDFSVANLIAAGEVVDRPASVIKELIENSIDAGATDIIVEIKHGGISLMRVTDNGKGITKEDLPLAIKRHATSKIKNAADLDSIMTLGFRGEALAAVSSVSRLRIMSKTPDASVGYLMESEGGEVKSISEAGCADGTTVIVENLFSNVPARLKFLKKDITESMAVSAYVEKIALSRPDIAMKLIIDGNMKFMTNGDSNLYNAIYILLGRDFARRMIQIDNKSDGLHIYGFIGTPDNIRANRNFQNFFINHRYVKSKTASAALEQAYATFIPSDKFPCAVMNIDISPYLVDVNVHPAKLEVKFSNEKLIFEAVYATVRQALEVNITRPEFKISPIEITKKVVYPKKFNAFVPIHDSDDKDEKKQLSFSVENDYSHKIQNQRDSYQPRTPKPVARGEEHEQKASPYHITADIQNKVLHSSSAYNAFNTTFSEDSTTVSEESHVFSSSSASSDKLYENMCADKRPAAEQSDCPAEASEEIKPVPEYKIIGEAFFSYIFVEVGERVLIIDKHAAHERIIFEELKRNMKKKKVISQLLLVPLDITLADAEIAAIEEYGDELRLTGFEFEIKGNTVRVTETPTELDTDSVTDMIQTIAGRISEGTGNVKVSRDIIYEKALFQASCKAAVKIGQRHDEKHLKWICDKVLSLDIIKFCPHGRPVAFEMSKHDFERQFKRI